MSDTIETERQKQIEKFLNKETPFSNSLINFNFNIESMKEIQFEESSNWIKDVDFDLKRFYFYEDKIKELLKIFLYQISENFLIFDFDIKLNINQKLDGKISSQILISVENNILFKLDNHKPQHKNDSEQYSDFAFKLIINHINDVNEIKDSIPITIFSYRSKSFFNEHFYQNQSFYKSNYIMNFIKKYKDVFSLHSFLVSTNINENRIKYDITIIKKDEIASYESKNIPNNDNDIIKMLCEHDIIKIPYEQIKNKSLFKIFEMNNLIDY